MADFQFNIAKGRIIELYNRVENNDPGTSALIIVPLEATGLETDAVLKDKDDLAAVLSGTTNEQTTMGRKTLTDAELAALPAPDDTNDWRAVDLPDITWTAATGNAVAKLLVCYDANTGAGTDSDIVPLCAYDWVRTPSGTDLTAVINDGGFFRSA